MAPKDKTQQPNNSRSASGIKELKDASQLMHGAKSLLENTTLKKAINEMKANIFEWICNSDHMEKEKREELYRFMKTIKNFENVLKVYVTKGANAQKKLEVITHGGKRT